MNKSTGSLSGLWLDFTVTLRVRFIVRVTVEVKVGFMVWFRL